ncbi:hypothetical protein C5B42_01755 [Candidatus Cerribacteria bacterium 'Amazon FNV 2010 28 9']|uniref:DUF805 domain-containing protein n=1 Tax=Candidatus Cerribacteria bacterium 'Amazon FNV 2010 28 9' TaxID=2081795 RepID=A0A317JP83_9BACT|nr:MAG: hypothetical protein C5B42_01755 [Candidatus Cerribacteria bacterium 'Amazon FNV 2010 28 9']
MDIGKLFQGRINRRTFILGILTVFLCMMIPLLLMSFFFPSSGSFESSFSTIIFFLIWLVVSICGLTINLSLFIRRWHDLGKSGWFILLQLVPYINLLFVLYLLFAQGQSKKNRFGSPPSSKIHWPQDILAMEIK